MKKRINLINGIILFFALSLFLIISIFIVSGNNYNNNEQELKNHIKLITEIYNGDNEAEVIKMYKRSHPNLRITFVTIDGDVVMDSSNVVEFENHLDRPELGDLGTIYIRYSSTLETLMMYIAYADDGLYIRLSMPLNKIDSLINSFMLLGIITLVILTILSMVLINIANKKSLAPLNVVVNKLSSIAGYQTYYGDDLERVSLHIDDINSLINEKINSIIDEKSKVNFIINNLNQGVIVVNSEGNIILVNSFVLDFRGFSEKEVLNKNYVYLIRDLKFQDNIESTINDGITHNFDIVIDQQTYSIDITPVISKWTGESNNKHGAFIFIDDKTEERKVEKIKREFFANASHELKSPLTSIIGYQQMITEGIISSQEEIVDASIRTIKEAKRMHQIILEMLDLSRLESKEQTKREDINIKNVINDVMDRLMNSIETKNLKLNVKSEDLVLNMNTSHLTQLVKNLVENAIKYNVVGGSLNITVNPKTREFIVEDTGIGIATEDQGRVFERFYRVDKARSKEQGGTGLGLAIVKHICNLYEANIILTSKPGKGTIIKIQFNRSTIAN